MVVSEQEENDVDHNGFDDFLKDMLRHQNDEEDKEEEIKSEKDVTSRSAFKEELEKGLHDRYELNAQQRNTGFKGKLKISSKQASIWLNTLSLMAK